MMARRVLVLDSADSEAENGVLDFETAEKLLKGGILRLEQFGKRHS